MITYKWSLFIQLSVQATPKDEYAHLIIRGDLDTVMEQVCIVFTPALLYSCTPKPIRPHTHTLLHSHCIHAYNHTLIHPYTFAPLHRCTLAPLHTYSIHMVYFIHAYTHTLIHLAPLHLCIHTPYIWCKNPCIIYVWCASILHTHSIYTHHLMMCFTRCDSLAPADGRARSGGAVCTYPLSTMHYAKVEYAPIHSNTHIALCTHYTLYPLYPLYTLYPSGARVCRYAWA
jgi:hypothetical protein